MTVIILTQQPAKPSAGRHRAARRERHKRCSELRVSEPPSCRQDGFDDFQPFSFELKTIARKNLSPARVKEYLKVIHKQSGVLGCKEVLEYVLMALAKYLQITVAYSIFKGEPQKATDHFEQFNEQFENLCEVFQEVTHRSFISGMISAQRGDTLPQAGNT